MYEIEEGSWPGGAAGHKVFTRRGGPLTTGPQKLMNSLRKGRNSVIGSSRCSAPGLVGVSRASGEVSGVVFGVRKGSFSGPRRARWGPIGPEKYSRQVWRR